MSNNTQAGLARKRAALIAQIVDERAGLAQQAALLRHAAQVIDKINDGIQHIKKHPEILLLPLAITVVSHPQRLVALGISALGLWRLLQSWRRLRLA
jgi:hypothetical protein